jgi:uncharacterized coiled-coil protein SlyX
MAVPLSKDEEIDARIKHLDAVVNGQAQTIKQLESKVNSFTQLLLEIRRTQNDGK